MRSEIKQPYVVAANKLLGEGYAFDAKTCFYERGPERLKLRWNGRVYARRRAPPRQDPVQEAWGDFALPEAALNSEREPAP